MPLARTIARRIGSGVKRRVEGVLRRVGLREAPPYDPPYSGPAYSGPAHHEQGHSPLHNAPSSPTQTPAEPEQLVRTEPERAEAADAAQHTDVASGPPLTREQVESLFEEMVRPALQSDGGDISLIKVEANDVYVELVGACQTCPSSVMTMEMGIERLLREEFPQFGRLIRVNETL